MYYSIKRPFEGIVQRPAGGHKRVQVDTRGMHTTTTLALIAVPITTIPHQTSSDGLQDVFRVSR